MIIKRNTHAPFRLPRLLIDCQRLAYKVKFDTSCVYNIGIQDQGDVNKLFGIGYFPHHHKNSMRFGWRYVIDLDAIELLAYYYVDGERNFKHIAFVPINHECICILDILEEGHILSVFDDNRRLGEFITSDPAGNDVGYLLRPYFGGNQKAPHDICLTMKRI